MKANKTPLIKQAKQLLTTGFFHIFGSSAINQVVRFAYSLLIVKVLTKAEFGRFSYTFNIFSFFLLVSGFSADSAVLQLSNEYAGDTDRSEALYGYGLRFGFAVNCFLSLLVFLTALLVPLNISGSNSLLMMMCLLPVFDIVRRLQIIWLRIKLRNRDYARINTLDAVILSVSALMCAHLLRDKGLVLGYYISAVSIVFLLIFWQKVPYRVGGGSGIIKQDKIDFLKIGGISTLNNALGNLLALLGTYILGAYFKNEELIASYKAATTIPFAIEFIPLALMTYVYPHFARNQKNLPWVRENYKKIMLYGGFVNLLISVFGVVLAPLAISIIYGRAYSDAVRPFQILMVSYFFASTFRIIAGNLLVTQRKLGFNLFVSVLGAVVSTVCNVLLIPRYYSNGAAFSHLITMAVTGFFMTAYFIFCIRPSKDPEQQEQENL